jgi:glycosyltransferase involved in cell wall biosynthesis
METKLILAQIMKNEEAVLERMLNSIKPIVDIICMVDTGSTDKSIEILKKWGSDNNVEVHILERPFDNFENSRNASMQLARNVVAKKNDDNTYYTFWSDCDEVMEISPSFNKKSLDKDLYMVNTTIGNMKYTRNCIARLDKNFTWYGPVHEFIVPPKDENGTTVKVSAGIADGVHVQVYTDGNSWKSEDVEKKYRKHAEILEEYINYKDRDPRWIFYTAQSYHDSATIKNNREENHERLRRALKYYKERVSINSGYSEERFYSQYRVGTIMRVLDEPWKDTLNECMKAYSIDPLRGESIKTIIEYYQSVGNWNLAYMYSLFAYNAFHNKNPYPSRLLFVDANLYNWRFLEVHASCCFYTQRLDEAKKHFSELLSILEKNSSWFSPQEIERINKNKKHFQN